MSTENFKPTLWAAGDLNAFFGLFTNVLVNILVITGLTLSVLEIPKEIVFGRVLPALGVAVSLGNLFYAYMAYQISKNEKRDTVTAMPYGPSVPHIFIVVFLVMLPTYLKTGDPILAWKLGLVWALLIGVIILLGAFVGPAIRKYTPRAAMLGTLAGVSLTFISMRPAFQTFEYPWIGLICFAIIMLSWVAHVRMPFGMPGGLVMIIVGVALAWGATLLGRTSLMSPSAVGEALSQFSLHLPALSGDAFTISAGDLWPLFITAIPLGIYNFTEGISNVESAAAAGDDFSLRKILLADGLGAIVGAFLGSPFPLAVFIGHPGWKAVGGGIGYSIATGVSTAVVCFMGLTALLLALIPLAAIIPILLFIGLVMGAQAFQACPRKHAPAIVLALIPNIAEWAKGQVDAAIGAAGATVESVGIPALASANVLYTGFERLGSGAVLAGLMLGAIAVFAIERRYNWAAIYSSLAALLSFVGFIHGAKLAINAAPSVTLGYLFMAGIFLFMALRQEEPQNWQPVDDNIKVDVLRGVKLPNTKQ